MDHNQGGDGEVRIREEREEVKREDEKGEKKMREGLTYHHEKGRTMAARGCTQGGSWGRKCTHKRSDLYLLTIYLVEQRISVATQMKGPLRHCKREVASSTTAVLSSARKIVASTPHTSAFDTMAQNHQVPWIYGHL